VSDVVGRKLRIDKTKLWRAFAIMINSGVGSLLSTYLDALCMRANQAGGGLVFIHESEMIFELPIGDDSFMQYLSRIAKQPLTDPALSFLVEQERVESSWSSVHCDAHMYASEFWRRPVH
jgi:hypothetical protein